MTVRVAEREGMCDCMCVVCERVRVCVGTCEQNKIQEEEGDKERTPLTKASVRESK